MLFHFSASEESKTGLARYEARSHRDEGKPLYSGRLGKVAERYEGNLTPQEGRISSNEASLIARFFVGLSRSFR